MNNNEEMLPIRKRLTINITSTTLLYSYILFFIYLGDSLMTYATPNYLDKTLGSTTLTGLLLSFASFIGIVSGVFIGEYFKYKTFYFFIKFLLIASLLFPLSLLIFQPVPIVLILAMSFWGIYPELSQFANAKFIDSEVKHEKRSSGWSTILTFKYLSYTLGPLLASLIIDKGEHTLFIAAIGFILISILCFIIGFKKKKKSMHINHLKKELNNKNIVIKPIKRKSILHEIKTWKIFFKTMWHIMLFLFMIMFIDSAFWTIGPIISESLKKQGVPGELLLFFYMVPSVIVTPLIGRFFNRYSKKKVSFIASAISCIFLAFAGIVNNAYIFLSLILVYSIVSSFIAPLLNAVFSDYIGRLKESSANLIELESLIMDLSYIIAPLITGFIADQTKPQETFFFIGICGTMISLLMLIVVPRKIHMPQRLLEI